MIELLRDIIFEEIVKGRALERYTTLISRELITSLKDKDIQDVFNTSGRVQYLLEVPQATNDIDYLRSIIVSINQGDRSEVVAQYEFDLNATDEQRKDSDIQILVTLPKNYQEDLSFLADFIAEVKDTIRHELEHSSQTTEELMTVQRAVPDRNIWKSLETAESYYLSDAEVKAWVAGAYMKAKKLKQPASEVMKYTLRSIYATGLSYGHSEQELEPLMQKLSNQYATYLFSRYRRAQ
jgi:hypothetical protein